MKRAIVVAAALLAGCASATPAWKQSYSDCVKAYDAKRGSVEELDCRERAYRIRQADEPNITYTYPWWIEPSKVLTVGDFKKWPEIHQLAFLSGTSRTMNFLGIVCPEHVSMHEVLAYLKYSHNDDSMWAEGAALVYAHNRGCRWGDGEAASIRNSFNRKPQSAPGMKY